MPRQHFGWLDLAMFPQLNCEQSTEQLREGRRVLVHRVIIEDLENLRIQSKPCVQLQEVCIVVYFTLTQSVRQHRAREWFVFCIGLSYDNKVLRQ